MVTINVTDVDNEIEVVEEEIELEEQIENELTVGKNDVEEEDQIDSNGGKSEGTEMEEGKKESNLESGTQTDQNWRKNFKVRVETGAPMFRQVSLRYARTAKKTKPEDMSAFTHEERFMAAVRDGDVSFVEDALDKVATQPLNVNCTDRNGRTAIAVAITRGNLLILKLLLKHNVALGDSLLRAVDTQFFEAVKLILKHSESYGDRQKEIVNCRSETDDYHPEITPIILACHHNNFEIIDVLLKYGARVPSPDSTDSERTAKHTLQRSVGTLNIYRALASQFYISKTSNDPMGDGFLLCHRLREMSGLEYEFRAEYQELADTVEEYAADLLGQARDSKELNKIMTHGPKKKKPGIGDDGATLQKVFMAISYIQKKFVAHPHCQQLLIKRFFGSLAYTRDWPLWKQLLMSLAIMIGYPFISIIYILVPTEKVNTFGDTPFVKFLMSVGSRLTFLIFLLIATSASATTSEDPSQQWTRIPAVSPLTTDQEKSSSSTAATFTGFKFGGTSSLAAESEKAPSAPKVGFSFGGASSDNKGFGFRSSSSSSSMSGSTAGKFSFGDLSKPASSSQDEKEQDEESDEPPTVEVKVIEEKDSLYSTRCKVFYKKGSEFKERGVGMLHLKDSGGSAQILIRADTTLGNVMLNIGVTSSMLPHFTKQGKNKNNVMMLSPLNPPADKKCPKCNKNYINPQESTACEGGCTPTPTPLLLRVKTEADADKLIAEIKKICED